MLYDLYPCGACGEMVPVFGGCEHWNPGGMPAW
jgi:hypothetical protein